MVSCSGRYALIVISGLFLCAGCIGGSGPQAIVAPGVDPTQAAERAIETYDTDGDGALSEDEYAKVPAIERHVGEYDANGDKRIGEDELAERFKRIFGTGTDMMSLGCRVVLNNRPLEGAEVVLQPEPFLGSDIKPARGTTDQTGRASMRVAAEDLPSANQRIAAVYVGLYKATISHPSATIHSAYQGDNTILGCEVSPLATQGSDVVFNIDSKGSPSN